jgi:hypothetical protein
MSINLKKEKKIKPISRINNNVIRAIQISLRKPMNEKLLFLSTKAEYNKNNKFYFK